MGGCVTVIQRVLKCNVACNRWHLEQCDTVPALHHCHLLVNTGKNFSWLKSILTVWQVISTEECIYRYILMFRKCSFAQQAVREGANQQLKSSAEILKGFVIFAIFQPRFSTLLQQQSPGFSRTPRLMRTLKYVNLSINQMINNFGIFNLDAETYLLWQQGQFPQKTFGKCLDKILHNPTSLRLLKNKPVRHTHAINTLKCVLLQYFKENQPTKVQRNTSAGQNVQTQIH